MPTKVELYSEIWFRREMVTEPMKKLRLQLLHYFDWSADRIGIIGNTAQNHMYGAHRSRNWLKNSRFATNRTYTTTETVGNRSGGTGDEVAGMDIIYGSAEERDDAAANLRRDKARGLLPMVWQIIVEDNPQHVHLSFDRGMLYVDMTSVYMTLIGAREGAGTKMVTVNVKMSQLAKGSQGDEVKTAQTLANLRGASPALVVDGDFGDRTDAAIVNLQRRTGAESIDGVVGPETWTILLAGKDQD